MSRYAVPPDDGERCTHRLGVVERSGDVASGVDQGSQKIRLHVGCPGFRRPDLIEDSHGDALVIRVVQSPDGYPRSLFGSRGSPPGIIDNAHGSTVARGTRLTRWTVTYASTISLTRPANW